MITRKRLQELIDKKEKIYYKTKYEIPGYWVPLENVLIRKNICDELVLVNDKDYWNFCHQDTKCISLDDLYETEEDSNEFFKYGNITKTLKFPFVSYNDFLRGKTIEVENVVSVSKATKFDCIVIWDMVKGKQQIIDYATRENYHKALDIARNLFLGVDKND